LRLLPDPLAKHEENWQCSRGARCRFLRQLSPRKIVHRNGDTHIELVGGRQAPTELVIFLPYAQWPDEDQSAGDPYLGVGLPLPTLKVAFGPSVQRRTQVGSRTPSKPRLYWSRPESLQRTVTVLQAARSYCSAMRVYGLERVKAHRDESADDDMQSEGGDSLRPWWGMRQHSKWSYGPRELRDVIDFLLGRDDGGRGRPDAPNQVPVEFYTIEEYMASEPEHELFDQELHPPEADSKWQTSTYWQSKQTWLAANPQLDLGEEDEHESDIDEDNPVPIDYDCGPSEEEYAWAIEREFGEEAMREAAEDEEKRWQLHLEGYGHDERHGD
jgi:hypothetical protein